MELAPGWLGIVVAAVGGAAVGVERQWSGHAIGRNARFGGVRTFTMLGAVAGLAGWLATLQYAALAAALTGGAVLLVIAGYAAASRRDVDATTEVAALVVIGAGLAAGIGWLALASAIVAVSTLLLVEKSRLHRLVRRIDDEELRAAARFAVMAVVILPLLPTGPFGPFGGIRPRELWLLVLFFSGLSFTGYLARRIVGGRHGYPVAGLLGGLISSTNVTYTFARLSRREPPLAQPLAIGVVGANAMLFPRVALAATVLNPAVGRAVAPYLVVPFLLGAAAIVFWWLRRDVIDQHPQPPSNPLQIVPALEMAVLFQLVLFLVHAARRYFGGTGLLATGAVLGLTDVDALTISMTKVAAAPGDEILAAQAIAVGILANTVLKTLLALGLGTAAFRRIAAGFVGAMAVALVASLVMLR
jgi:uncharacterized membrane protein (DUF4010 family)